MYTHEHATGSFQPVSVEVDVVELWAAFEQAQAARVGGQRTTTDETRQIEWIERPSDGRDYSRIPFGRETSFGRGHTIPVPCHDCAAALGERHVRGCDMEECPICFGQLLSCDHGILFEPALTA